MAFPDKKFPWIWAAFLIGWIVMFAVIEGVALAWGDTTLSRFVWEVSQQWPLVPVLYGMVLGGLAVHFWWHWSPPGSKSEG